MSNTLLTFFSLQFLLCACFDFSKQAIPDDRAADGGAGSCGTGSCDASAGCEGTPGDVDCSCSEVDAATAHDRRCGNVDECADAALHDCDTEPMACVDLTPKAGGWSCTCPKGFMGNGRGTRGCIPLPDDIEVSIGALGPGYDPDITAYTVDVAIWQESVEVRVTIPAGPSVTLNGAPVESGQLTGIPLSLGANTVAVAVRDGEVSRTYTLMITRGAPMEHYLKASNAGAKDQFGSAVWLSGDGNTLAVGAEGEASSSRGVNSTPNNSASNAGAVYVFSRTGSRWIQQAYLKASNTRPEDRFGCSVSLSSDGNLLAVGAEREASSGTGVNSIQDTEAVGAGAVYVFTRKGGSWSQQAYIKASNTGRYHWFGESLSLSGDGTMLAVGAPNEDSSSTGVNSTPNEGAMNAGAVYIFTRAGNSWSQQAYLKASNTGVDDSFGRAVSLSRDAATLAVGAYYEDSSGRGVDSKPNDDATDAGAVYVFTRTAGSWTQQAYLKASNRGIYHRFGGSVALSENGATLAVGAAGEESSTTGVKSIPDDGGGLWYGAVYVFARASSSWTQQAYIKPSKVSFDGLFGLSVSLSGPGDTLAVGAPDETSSTSGLNPAPDQGARRAGAVYVFTRTGGNWGQQAFLKAANAGAGDFFGFSVALSGDGASLACGAIEEGSSSSGINSTPNEDAGMAGAAYVLQPRL